MFSFRFLIDSSVFTFVDGEEISFNLPDDVASLAGCLRDKVAKMRVEQVRKKTADGFPQNLLTPSFCILHIKKGADPKLLQEIIGDRPLFFYEPDGTSVHSSDPECYADEEEQPVKIYVEPKCYLDRVDLLGDIYKARAPSLARHAIICESRRKHLEDVIHKSMFKKKFLTH